MNRMLLLCFLLFLTCGAQKSPYVYPKGLSEMKQELARAQKKLQRQQTYVKQLEEEIARREISAIQQEIDLIYKDQNALITLSHEEWLLLFHQQRETLGKIMHLHPACRDEAQNVLNQILVLITQLSE